MNVALSITYIIKEKYMKILIATLLLVCIAFTPLLLYPSSAEEYEQFNSKTVAFHVTGHTRSQPVQLWDYLQPVDVTLMDGLLKMHIIDVLFVDGALIAAWTIQNMGNVSLYLVDEIRIGEYTLHGYYYHGFGGILEPGETRNCDIAGYVDESEYRMFQGDEHMLSISVAGLRLMG